MSRVPLLHDQFESDFVPPLSDIEALETEKPRSQNLHGRKSKFWQLQALALCLIISFSGGFLAGYLTLLPLSAIKRFFEPSPTTSLSPTGFHPRCSSPGIRHEWRSLSRSQQEAYITAVKCLKRKPSRLNLNQTLYDDFPYIHASIGEYSHHSAAFLVWHRYFLHIYEKALQEDCGYEGRLTYWNWSLDAPFLTSAPIWSASTFGTNGSATTSIALGETAILGGTCVADGQFANTRVLYLDGVLRPHCLSRGFLTGQELRGNGSKVSSTAVEEILRADTYSAFNIGLENGPHDAVPRIIRGDFSLFTAPSDPVFFLHHTQLDRLWRLWQERDLDKHLWQYDGYASHKSEEEASLDDVIPMGGLGPDVFVKDIMDTRAGMLCYA